MKTHWKKATNPNYIGAYELMTGGEPDELTVTIERVVKESVKGADGKEEQCTVAYLKGYKPFILNKTNLKSIEQIHKTPYLEDWQGKQIVLYVKNIKAFGDWVDALRVKAPKPKPHLKADTETYMQCVTGLKNGYTLEQVQAKYIVSESVKAKLVFFSVGTFLSIIVSSSLIKFLRLFSCSNLPA